ncbi:MAG: SulP family inorganic anion transporter [Betaproteobacteria bacterium]|nr:SulP family inorganic anion transporter [Betaproteobacteria bacterium]
MNDHRVRHRPVGLARWLPGLALFAHYPRQALRGDVVAGLSAFLVMIPSVLAYSELVGVPPVTGLYAAIGAMAGYALFSRGIPVIAGPDATTALLAAAVVAPLAGGDPARTVALATALPFLVGAALVIASRLQVGDLADLLSKPVLVGYLNGSALILIGTQIGKLLGVPLVSDQFFLRIAEVLRRLPSTHAPTLALGLSLIVLLFLLRRFLPTVPGSLVACVVGIAAAVAFDLSSHGVALLGEMPQGLPRPQIPAVSGQDLLDLAPGALALATLIFAEGILLARAIAANLHEDIDANGELTALGTSNVGSGLLGGYTVGSSGSRTLTVAAYGGRTQMAQWAAVALLLLFVLVLAPLLEWLPVVALAALLIYTGIALFDWNENVRLRRLDPGSFRLSLGVTLGVLVLGVLPGILVGVALSVLGLLISTARPRDALLRKHPPDHRYHDLDDDQPGASPPGILVYRIYAPLVFANARHVAARVGRMVRRARVPVRCIVFDMQAVTGMDITAMEVFEELLDRLAAEGVDIRFSHANRPLREQLMRLGLTKQVGAERFFHAAWEAVEDYQKCVQRSAPAADEAR